MRFTKPLPVRLASHGAIVTRPRLALLEKGIGAAICVSHKGGLATPHMRDQTVQVEVPAGMLEVIVTGEALDTLRKGAGVFQDGTSLVRHYRSFIAEIAREKHDESGCLAMRIVLGPADVCEV